MSVRLLFPLLMLFLFACGGPITEEDLQKWTNNDIGFKRVSLIVRDTEVPLETRARALEILVEKRQEARVRGMLDMIADEKDRDAVAQALSEQLMVHIEKGTEAQLSAKDTLLSLTRYITDEQVEKMQQSIAKWAFSDIAWESSADEVKEKLTKRLSGGQVADLGKYGHEAAAILLSHGYAVEQMVPYLLSSKSPETEGLLLRGLKKYLPEFGVNNFILDRVNRSDNPEAVKMFLGLYLDQSLDQNARNMYFATAVAVLENAKAKMSEQDRVDIAKLFLKIGEGQDPEDIWLAAANVNAISQGKMLDEVLALFREDIKYADAPENPGKSVMDFCFDLDDLKGKQKDGQNDKASFAASLKKAMKEGNRIQAAIAILCAKTLNEQSLKPDIEAFYHKIGEDSDHSVRDFLGEGVYGDDEVQVSITLGFLAKNALDAFPLLSAVEADLKAKTLTEKQADAKKFLIAVEFESEGNTFKNAVESRYQSYLAEEAREAAAAAEAEKEEGAPKDEPEGQKAEQEDSDEPEGQKAEQEDSSKDKE